MTLTLEHESHDLAWHFILSLQLTKKIAVTLRAADMVGLPAPPTGGFAYFFMTEGFVMTPLAMSD